MTNPKSASTTQVTVIEPELGALLGVFALYHFVESVMGDIEAGIDLSHFERKIVVWLDRPKRLGTLAREMNALPSTMTAAADQLESRGLVIRKRDPEDRRAWLLNLTTSGAMLRAEVVMLASTLLRETLELTDEELTSFAKTSLKIHSKIQQHTTC